MSTIYGTVPEKERKTVESKVKRVMKNVDSGATIDVFRSSPGHLQIFITSEKFRGSGGNKLKTHVWKSMEDILTKSEALAITLCMMVSPEEVPWKVKSA